MDGSARWIQEALAEESVPTVEVRRGEVLLREGCDGQEAYVLVEGAAEVTVGGLVVGGVAPGELFGEIAPLVGGPRTATVVATAASRLAVLDPATTQALLQRPEVSRGVASRLATWLGRAQRPEGSERLACLTRAELGVAALVVKGLTNRQIAARLLISSHTVDAHLRHAFTKLGITSRVELAALAVRAGAG